MPFIQPPVTPTPSGIDLSGKTVIITGGNAGLGFETARQLLVLRASAVVLAVRNLSKGEGARSALLADPHVKSRNPRAVIKIMHMDMEDYKSVLAFADEVTKELQNLHILLLNAGIGQLTYEKSITGHEKVTQVNYLSNSLLALKLLPLLKATAAKTGHPTRMSWVGSRTHHQNSLAKKQPLLPEEKVLEHFADRSKYLSFAHYGDTKLLCIMFIKELAERVPREEVIINSMCPGMVNTGMSDVLPLPLRVVADIVKKMRARSVEEGGWIITHAAAVVGTESHGRFLQDNDITK